MGLLDKKAEISGEIMYDGKNLLNHSDKEMNEPVSYTHLTAPDAAIVRDIGVVTPHLRGSTCTASSIHARRPACLLYTSRCV